MKFSTLHEIFLILTFVLVQNAVKPVASNLSYPNKNVVKIKQDPTRFKVLSGFRYKKHIYATRYDTNTTTSRYNNKLNAYLTYTPSRTGGNYNQDKNVHNIDKSTTSQNKKWQVGRVSRKQYEIINMLWRKTKIFGDVEPTTANYLFRRNNESTNIINQSFIRHSSLPSSPSTTPSYIEFYYLDETDERARELTTQKPIQVPTIRQPQLRNHGNHKFVLSGSPMFSFRIHEPNYKRSSLTTGCQQITNIAKRRKSRTHDYSSRKAFISQTPSYKPSIRIQDNTCVRALKASSISKLNTTYTLNITSTLSTSDDIYDNETCPTTDDALTYINDTTESGNKTSEIVNTTPKQNSTTAYDKIKFFEMYDNHTPLPYYDENDRLYDKDKVDNFIKDNEINNNKHKVLLEHVDQSIGNEHSKPHKGKHAKKHIIDTYKNDLSVKNGLNDKNKETLALKETLKPTQLNASNVTNTTKQSMLKLLQIQSKVPLLSLHDYGESKHVKWSQYPFAAAYIYEPSQVHCDAAGISPHWLVTSGSCLSRHHKNPGGEGRSAFVAYCGDAWWNPERVAYVKYSVVHPRFNPRDRTRRHLYNIGLIQVVNSMSSACTGWTSIPLISHQIAVEGAEGAIANAIGWGLDRFDVRYSNSDLPKSLLMSYESKVFSHSCPGNIGYGKAKRLDEEGGIRDVYCLALPPYLGEATDPIHGGLLLVGGKLVALYLQEERRPWGDQSAQYTGTWRLVPWILDVARENDFDTFTLDI